jgi:two-component system, chemotaxis family, response regulator Rcp1
MSGTAGPARILLVEDNLADVRLTREILGLAGVSEGLYVARDGVEALAALRVPGGVLPDLVLLDLNLPRKSGLEVLAEIKADPVLRSVPVVVLSTSRAVGDVSRAYELHANAYVAKPLGLAGFSEALGACAAFWLRAATLPPGPRS